MNKKYRGENWTTEEKEIFIDLMKYSVRIIECKNTDTDSNKRKQAEWRKVQKQFKELTGKFRDVAQLKGFWRRTRMLAKKNVFQHRRALNATRGVERPPSPSHEDQKIVEMCSTDFVTEENEEDSDGIFNKNVAIKNPHPTSNLEREIKCEMMMGDQLTMSIPHIPQESIFDKTRNHSKIEESHEAALIESNLEIKKDKTLKLLEEEYALKLEYQRKELCHQELRHKLELEILLLEKEKKEYELKLLKK